MVEVRRDTYLRDGFATFDPAGMQVHARTPRFAEAPEVSEIHAACLAAPALDAGAVTYANTATTFSWIDASAHTKVGYNTVPYMFNNTGGCGTTPPTLDDTHSYEEWRARALERWDA